MVVDIRLIPQESISSVVPLVKKLSKKGITEAILLKRFQEMVTQNYECVGMFVNHDLIGVCGLWYCTRHYSGRSVELDHVIIESSYRNQGLGAQLMDWVQTHVKAKGCEAIELNTYTENKGSHNFYHQNGFIAPGLHFLKSL